MTLQAVGWILELSPTVLTILYPLWVVKRYFLTATAVLTSSTRYQEKGYQGSHLLKRITQPSDSWEKTNGMAVSNMAGMD